MEKPASYLQLKRYASVFLLFLGFWACNPGKPEPAPPPVILKKTPADTILTVGSGSVWILSPTQHPPVGDILILPGWNFENTKIYEESSFCQEALKRGYRLVLPQMLKSVYATSYFPETREDYRKNLTLTWVADSLIPALKHWDIWKTGFNAIHGISTGGRGGALVHLRTDTLFQAVALLSGDYDQTTMPSDNLMTNTYGAYAVFPERWEETDNPRHQMENWKAPVFLAHGTQDSIVPTNQTVQFARNLAQEFPKLKMDTVFVPAGHDFDFWNRYNARILDFFDAIRQKK